MFMGWFEKILGPKLNKVFLWLGENVKRQVISFVFLVLVTLVVSPKIVKTATDTSFSNLFISFVNFTCWAIGTKNYIFILTIALILLTWVFAKIYFRVFKKTIEVNPEKEPGLWSYYKDSGWSLIEDKDCWEKVLKITNCTYPAILKFGDDWIDYCFSFQVKVPSFVPVDRQNFSFVVRARDKANNIFLQCKPDGKIRPHLLAGGIFIIDDKNEIDFLAEYPLDKWFDVKMVVEGDKITIFMMGVSATYKIPSEHYAVSSGMISPTMPLSKIKEFNLGKNNKKMEPSGGVMTSAFMLNLDYEKGTIGFRESGKETALFRKIKIELKHPFGE